MTCPEETRKEQEMTYLEEHQPELVLEMLDLAVLAHVEEHRLEEQAGDDQ